MNPTLLLQNIKTFLSRYSLQQKLGMAFAAALVMVLLWAMVHFVNKVEYQVLYSELDPQEAQSIVTQLQSMKASYELSQDGTTIRVESSKISEIRIQLASQGLPETGRVGFEIFDRTNFGLTNFQEQVNYQRALEGELARSVMTLNEVAAARVHLVMPKESLYANDEEPTKASVILKLKNNRTLAPSSVQGIVNVLASSVKGLSPDKVTVIDYRGKVLSRSEEENSLTGQQADTRQKMENEMSAKIVQILEPTVGSGKVRPQVSIALNFQQVEETIEQYDPNAVVIRSQQREQENGPGSRSTGGIVGVRSGQAPPAAAVDPNAPPAAPAVAVNAPLHEKEVINYEVSKSIRHVINPVGKVERISVAVILDNQTQVAPNAEGQPETTVVPRSPEEMKKYRDLVAAAIAFNPERGDQLIVENMSFENETEVLSEPTFFEKQAPQLMTGLRYVIIPIVFLLVYLLFIRPVQKTVFGGLQPAAAGLPGGAKSLTRGTAQAPMTVQQLEARLQNGGPLQLEQVVADAAASEMLPMPSATKMDIIRKRVVEQAKQDPETIARLVRVWLNEEKNR